MKKEILTPRNRAGELVSAYNLHTQSVIFQSIYIAGGQEEHRELLRKNYFIDNQRPKEPKDPENPSEIMHYISWNMHFTQEEKLGINHTVPRKEAFFIAASLIVHEMLHESIGTPQPVQVPVLAPDHIRNTFGNFITFRQ